MKNGEDFATVAKEVPRIRARPTKVATWALLVQGLRPSIRRCALCIERRRGLGTSQVGVRLAHHQAARRPVTGGLGKHEAGAGTRAEGPAGRATLRGDQQTAGRCCLRGIRPGAACAGAGFDGADHRSVRARGAKASRPIGRSSRRRSARKCWWTAPQQRDRVDPDTAVVIRVKEHLKPAAIPLADVRDDIAATRASWRPKPLVLRVSSCWPS